jgi:hypothetical protein
VTTNEYPEYEGSATPAGAGMIVVGNFGPLSATVLLFTSGGTAWIEQSQSRRTIVFAGADPRTPMRGRLNLVRTGTVDFPFGLMIDSPGKTGSLQIVDAVGERLILKSDGGRGYYFDVPGLSFVASLGQIVPTITSEPSRTPIPGMPLPYDDDAPDVLWQVWRRSPANQDLRYRLTPEGDRDWFAFGAPPGSNIAVTLSAPSPGYILAVQEHLIPADRWQDGGDDRTDLAIEVENARDVSYYVEVSRVEGVADSGQPYTLRFSIRQGDPSPEGAER